MSNPTHFDCACGFRWEYGRDGGHYCTPQWQAKVNDLAYALRQVIRHSGRPGMPDAVAARDAGSALLVKLGYGEPEVLT